MTTIGKLNLQLQANPSGFTSALDKSGRALKHFGGLVSGVFKGFTSPTAIFSGLGDLFRELVTEQFDIIDEISKQADVLDLSTEALTSFQHAAELSGVTNEELTKGLETFIRTMGKTQIITETAGASLEKFGIDVDELAAMGTEAAVARLADEYVKLPPGIDRATFATAAFGKAGIKLSKFLEEGSEGLAKFKEEATTLGRTFSRSQGAEVERAGDAIARISLAFDGLKRQLAIGIAPLVADIADRFMDWLKNVGGIPGIAQKIMTFFFDLAELLIGIGETIADIVLEIKRANLGETLVGSGLSRFGQDVAAGRVGGTSFTGARESIEKARRNMAGLGEGPEKPKQFKTVGFGFAGGLKALASGLAGDLVKDIDKLQESLTKQIDTWGMSADAITLWELKLRGATDAQLANVLALQEQLAGMERVQELAREALTLPEAALAGTSVAVSAINRFNANREGQNQNARLEELLRLDLVEQRRQTEELRKIVRGLTGDQL